MASERIAAKRAALRGRIIDVALTAFAARGFEATTMTDIADQLQMTGPALYHYFSTKDQLLFACVEQLLEQLVTDVGRAAGGAAAPRERMASVVRAQVALELKHGSAAPLINAHLYGPQYLTDMLGDEHREILRGKQRTLVQTYRSLIDEGVAAGQFSVANTAIAAFNVLAIIQYSGVWYRPQKGRKVLDAIEAQVDAVLRLLGAVPREAATPATPAAPASSAVRSPKKGPRGAA